MCNEPLYFKHPSFLSEFASIFNTNGTSCQFNGDMHNNRFILKNLNKIDMLDFICDRMKLSWV